MRTIIILSIFSLLTQFGIGQIIPSSCFAPDSIIKKYKADADRLALQEIYQKSLSYVDSIEIPQEHSDSMLNALIAVYNASSIPEADTIVKIFNIHTFPDPIINTIFVSADSNLVWMQKLRNNNIPTDNSTIDSLMILYDLSVYGYQTHFGLFEYHTVVFITDSNYNTYALAEVFKKIPGVYSSYPPIMEGDGSNISALIYPAYTELVYSMGWGDCPCGCTERRYWKFNVYFDCSVEFVASYGSLLPTSVDSDTKTSIINIYPNPFQDKLYITGMQAKYEYIIYNIMGQKLIHGRITENNISNIDWLPSGQYLLFMRSDNDTRTFKLCKN